MICSGFFCSLFAAFSLAGISGKVSCFRASHLFVYGCEICVDISRPRRATLAMHLVSFTRLVDR